MHLVIYGPEGSGKGTQAKLLSEKLNLPIYTSGDIVREKAAKDQGFLGQSCRQALKEGKYVPDEIMFILWEDKLKQADKKGFILDGFPRTLKQAKFLIEKTARYGYQPDMLIHLHLDDDTAVARLSLRKRTLYKGSKILHDDPKRVKQRLAIFRKQEKLILDFFRKRNLLLEVDGKGTVEEVFSKIYMGLGLSP
jgi:adenylate kinase